MTSLDRKKYFQNCLDEYVALSGESEFKVLSQSDINVIDQVDTLRIPYCETYLPQDLWGAQKVYKNKPKIHYDVASSGWSFIPNLLGFRDNIISIDIRPMASDRDGVEYICANATNLETIEDDSIESLSALCSVEHFGLGRYGDPIEPDAWEKALRSFQRVIASGGRLYLSLGIREKDTLKFNDSREFAPQTIIDALPKMKLMELSVIANCNYHKYIVLSDEGKYVVDRDYDKIAKDGTVGLFEFLKL